MSSNNTRYVTRSWMYERIDPKTNLPSDEYCQGLENFMRFAKNQPLFLESGKLFCPCYRCKNGRPLLPEREVSGHLYNRGFMPNYWVWISHGENYDFVENHSVEDALGSESQTEPMNPYVAMVSDAFCYTESGFDHNMEEEPNLEAKKFYAILDAAKHPIYNGCKESLSQLSLAARLMKLKTDYNLPNNCMDAICEMMKEYLPEDNNAMESYYELKKLMRSLGLPYQKIDVCQDNCMLFWKDDADIENCLFCKKDRFHPTQKPGQKKIAYRQMFYLPISDRLKRLYQSEVTAKDMRWHAEHTMSSGEMCHPSDGEEWKHFQEVFPDFASEPRNVYLGLCTDGFNPFGMSGHNYSLWPVILTPYNLPPEVCMKQELMFLTVLVPGPNHPKRNLDIFLQPLIEELKDLWYNGVNAYDIYTKQNFLLRAVMSDYWRTPKAKGKSEKARTSRLSTRDGLGVHRHRAGSRSYVKVQDALVANNEDSSFIAVMKKTHQKSDGTYVDEKARLIAEKFDEHVEELLSQRESSNGEGLTQEEKNEIYVKIAGISKQGRVFGIGSLHNGISTSLGDPSVPQPTEEEFGTLNHRLEEVENELKKSRDVNLLLEKRLQALEDNYV